MNTDVAIIGGGPNGLLMACELALAGTRPVVLERLPEPTSVLKANGLVGRVVQALDYRGIYELFSGSATPPVPAPGFQFGGLPLDLSTVEDNPLFMLPIPQRRMETLLAQRATELGVEVRRGHELVGLMQDGERVTAQIAGPDGSYELTARYLVGADGGRSAVRKLCGIDFPGITDRGFVGRSGQVSIPAPIAAGAGGLDIPGFGPLRPATFTRTDTGMFVYGMFQPGVYRVATYEWGAEPVEDAEDIPLAELRAAVRRVLDVDLPMSAPDAAPLAGRRMVGVNSRQARRYRHGRVFLAGDAAHVHSGIGGPGLNLGLQDVLNLAWKLAAAVNGWAPEGLLDTYQSERHPVGARVVMQTRVQTMLLSPGANVTALRELLTGLLGYPATRRHLAELMAGADVGYATTDTHPMAGRWLPDLLLDNGTRVSQLLRAARPVLLNLSGDAQITDAADGWADRVDVVTAGVDARAGTDLAAVLVRPDGYVAWASDDGADGLPEALAEWFGAPIRLTAGRGAA